jgi:DNA/RNA-binding domain of Phe-tRNA-synthetase-like protein
MFVVSETWQETYPGAVVGVLAMRDVANPKRHPELDRLKDELEKQLRARFVDKQALRALETLQAYKAYYRRFKKSYQVQMQLESVVIKGRSIPRMAALVEAMFVAELKNQLLTAGHDLDIVRPPLRLDVAQGTEHYVRINGQEQQLKAGDMFIADTEGVLSCVIYGPDRHTQISADTQSVLFTVYAPPGIGKQAMVQHLRDLEANARLIAPQAKTELLEVYGGE